MKAKAEDVIFRSTTDEWGTPDWLFATLDRKYNFTLDPCATDENHKCKKYYTQKENGLSKDWSGEIVFCNPPYSQVEKWCKKAFTEAQKENTVVVMLLPARTDTRWFHRWVYHVAEIEFLKGRVKFINGNSKYNAPFPSMVCVFKNVEKQPEQMMMEYMDKEEEK